jgi:hypothetical protein
MMMSYGKASLIFSRRSLPRPGQLPAALHNAQTRLSGLAKSRLIVVGNALPAFAGCR